MKKKRRRRKTKKTKIFETRENNNLMLNNMENIRLFNGDCIEVMKEIETGSVDLVFCDLPYGITSCSWDIKIDLEKFWKEINRITKETTPIFFTTTTKFGVELIMSNPKNFRYDLVWVKSASCGFMNAKKMPMRKHEMIYVFYRKLPLYNLESHKHKFKDSTIQVKETIDGCYNDKTFQYIGEARKSKVYEPPLPDSVIEIRGKDKEVKEDVYNADERFISGKLYHYPRQLQKGDESIYDPPLPNSILEIKSKRGKHSTQKPVDLINWILKYYSKEGDVVLDPTMGSGSTGIACKGMNRKFIGIELCEDIFTKAKENILSP
jgi:site-specific DNA-methyltransferase (adenine-specific)